MIAIILALSILNITGPVGRIGDIEPVISCEDMKGLLQPNQECRYTITNTTTSYVITDSPYKITVYQNHSIKVENITK